MNSLAARALVELVLTRNDLWALGVQVVLRRLAFFTDTLGHIAFLGIVAVTVTGIDIKIGAAAAAACAIALAGRGGIASRRGHQHSGVMVSGALVFGVVLISTRPGFSKDLRAALVGSPLTVTGDDIAVAVAVLVAVALILGHKELILAAFDPTAIRALGYRTHLIDGALLALLAVTVVTAAPAVGAMLPLALLVGPAAAAILDPPHRARDAARRLTGGRIRGSWPGRVPALPRRDRRRHRDHLRRDVRHRCHHRPPDPRTTRRGAGPPSAAATSP